MSCFKEHYFLRVGFDRDEIDASDGCRPYFALNGGLPPSPSILRGSSYRYGGQEATVDESQSAWGHLTVGRPRIFSFFQTGLAGYFKATVLGTPDGEKAQRY
jgi:hypothetical protein